MVEFKNITYNYSSKSGIYDVDLSIKDDEFCFLVGPTGSGKSTLLKLLYFDLFPDKGDVRVLKYLSSKIKKKDIHIVRKKIGVIFQDYKLLNQRRDYEYIALPFQINCIGRKKISNLVIEALELTELSRYSKKFPNELSGGEQQRVCIARAIVKNPDIILADEPTGNLDPTTGHKILRILEQINKEGTCVIMATHNYKLIAEKPYRVIELDQGRVVSE